MIFIDLPVSNKNVFFWWPDVDGNAPDPHEISANLLRFEIDPHSDELDLPEPELLLAADCEFPKIDDRWAMKQHTICYFDVMDKTLGTDWGVVGPAMGGGFAPYNSLGKFNNKTCTYENYFPGPDRLFQEPVFIPRDSAAAEGDGYLMALVNNYQTMSSELHIIDTRDFSQAIAIVLLPLRLRAGLHGNWVEGNELRLVR